MKIRIEPVKRGQIITKRLAGSMFVSKPAPGDGFLLGLDNLPSLFVLADDLSDLVHGRVEAPVEIDPWRYEDEEASPESVSPE